MDSNEKNLYDFYRLIGWGKYASYTEARNYCVVSGNHGSWPQMIFEVDLKQSKGFFLDKIFSEAAGKTDVRFAVCNKAVIKNNDQESLRLNDIFPVGRWQLMEIGSKEDLNRKVKTEYQIKKLSTPAEIDEYTAFVNDNLMMNPTVKRELFQELVHHKTVEVFGLLLENELLSGLLSFTDSNNVAGLYFIATKKAFRGKGLAAEVIYYAVQSLFARGTGKVVLQSMPKALPLYARMGFSRQGELVILWKK